VLAALNQAAQQAAQQSQAMRPVPMAAAPAAAIAR
jgi:hypothetical protein